MAILSKGCKPNNFESHNSLKFSFTDVWSHCFIFVDWESFLKLDSPNTLPICKANLDDSINSGNFPVRVYLRLILKNSTPDIQNLAFYVKQGLPIAWELSLENSADSYICCWVALSSSFRFIPFF